MTSTPLCKYPNNCLKGKIKRLYTVQCIRDVPEGGVGHRAPVNFTPFSSIRKSVKCQIRNRIFNSDPDMGLKGYFTDF